MNHVEISIFCSIVSYFQYIYIFFSQQKQMSIHLLLLAHYILRTDLSVPSSNRSMALRTLPLLMVNHGRSKSVQGSQNDLFLAISCPEKNKNKSSIS